MNRAYLLYARQEDNGKDKDGWQVLTTILVMERSAFSKMGESDCEVGP